MINQNKLFKLVEINWKRRRSSVVLGPPIQEIDGDVWIGDGFTLWRTGAAEVVVREKAEAIASRLLGKPDLAQNELHKVIEIEQKRDQVEVLATNLLVEMTRGGKPEAARLMVAKTGDQCWIIDERFFDPIEDLSTWEWKSHAPTNAVTGWYLGRLSTILMPMSADNTDYTPLAAPWIAIARGRPMVR